MRGTDRPSAFRIGDQQEAALGQLRELGGSTQHAAAPLAGTGREGHAAIFRLIPACSYFLSVDGFGAGVDVVVVVELAVVDVVVVVDVVLLLSDDAGVAVVLEPFLLP